MSELTRLSQVLIDEPLAPRPLPESLRLRSRRRQLRRRSITVGLLALIVITAFSVVRIGDPGPRGSTTPRGENSNVQLLSYFQAAVNVSDSTLAAVGLPATVAIPTKIAPSLSTVGTNGVISYVGAEYCPYCAIQRWALLVALSKFGTFTHLDKQVFSSSSDVYPHLASWSFVDTRYKSPYFTFEPTETSSSTPNGRGRFEPLEKMSPAQRSAFDKYDPQGVLPFVDVGNNYIALGASTSPSVLEGLSLSTIGSDLNDPTSPVARAIDGTANYLIAALCTMESKAAPPVCSTFTSRAAAKALGTGVSPTSQVSGATTYPTQPPTNAPKSVWKEWSAKEHAFWLATAGSYRSPDSACTVIKISITGRTLTKPLFGIPAGVTLWGMSLLGKCTH
jgi:hypothetical protein